MRHEYVEQIEELQSSLANDRHELREAVDRVKRAVSEPLDVPRRIREDLERLDRSVRRFVGERPLTAVLLGLTTGYVVGRVLTRFR